MERAREASMDYEQAVETTVTKAQALREIAKHDANVAEFFEDCGDHAEYEGKVVLDWLGY